MPGILGPSHGSGGSTGGTLQVVFATTSSFSLRGAFELQGVSGPQGVFGVISGYEILVVALAAVALSVIVGAAVIGVITRFVRGDVSDVHGPPEGSPLDRLRMWLTGRSPGR